MVVEHEPSWPDKAMFSAILLILAGSVGGAFELLRPIVEVDQDRLPVLFTDDVPGYTLTLSAATVAFGLWSLRKQAAVPAYLGACAAVLSIGLFGLVPLLALVATGFMVRSHVEGEETRLDDQEVPFTMWPDKALAASLLFFVLGAVACAQSALILAGRFDPIWMPSAQVAAVAGLAVAAICFAAAHQVYRLHRPWLGWLAAPLGLATLGFYLIGPVLAVAALVLLVLAHHEDEFILFDGPARAAKSGRRRGRRRRPTSTIP